MGASTRRGRRRVARAVLGALAWCALLGACSPRAARPPADARDVSGLIQSADATATVAPGGDESLALSLLDEVLPLDLAVYVRYADGTTQEIDKTVDDSPVTLRWTVPSRAVLGAAQARVVATRTCECGSYPPHQGTVLATFSVASPHAGWRLIP